MPAATSPASKAKPIPKRIRQAPLGERIRWARQQACLSHDRLAEKVGSSRFHLIALEKGRHVPRHELRKRIARATRQPLDLFAD